VLVAAGVPAAGLDEIDAEVRAQVETATQQARDGGLPDPELVTKDVWADGGSAWRN
jgi:pyruvate dehydrogenase E1 component alpha subunit